MIYDNLMASKAGVRCVNSEIDDEDKPVKAKSVEDDEKLTLSKLHIDIWKQAVETQKHFNDMCVKSRQLGLTFVAASLGAAFYLFIRSPSEGGGSDGVTAHAISEYSVSICGHTLVLHVSLFIIAAAAAAVLAVKYLDLGVYHQMLRGAVTFGEDLEEKHIKKIVGLQKGMTQTISHYSRNSDANKFTGVDGQYSYIGDNQKHAGRKLVLFYRMIFGVLTAFAIVFSLRLIS
jgi:hypothetical protein